MRKETNIKDCEGKMIFEGDIIECNCPIYEKPKRFKVQWDNIENRYSLPKNNYILSFCRKIESNNV